MKRARHTEEQIISVLKEAQAGAAIDDLCRRHGISQATYYKWKQKFGGMEVNDARRLRQLEDENRQLKAGGRPSPRQHGFEGTSGKKVLKPKARRSVMTEAISRFGLSARRVCRLTGWNRSSLQYECQARDDTALRERLRHWASLKPRWGAPILHDVLKAEGLVINRKRTERLYREEGLSLRRKRHRKLPPAS